jgi:predicted RNA-binding protein YlqC (UPF0109 family)
MTAMTALRDDDDEAPTMENSDILEEIVRKLLLLDHDEVKIEEKATERTSILTIHVPPAARGRVIGRQGHHINVIRSLFAIYGGTQNKNILIELAGDTQRSPVPKGKHNFQPRSRPRRP